jgi:hypothetical protein
VLLQFSTDADERTLIGYRLYDEEGNLVAQTKGLTPVRKEVTVKSKSGEVLLNVPADRDKHITYRLYNNQGTLLTFSDGSRTMIYGSLRMESR